MTRLLTILLCVCCLGAAKLPNGAKLSWLLMQPAAAPSTTLSFSVTPATNFTLFASATMDRPRANWAPAATGTGSITLPLTAFAGITNPIAYAQSLSWIQPSNTLIYFGTASGHYTDLVNIRRGTNVTLTGLTPVAHFYVATQYNQFEGPQSVEVSATPQPVYQPRTLFFIATAPVPTRLLMTVH